MSHFNHVASEWDNPNKVQMMKSLAGKVSPLLGNLENKSLLDFGCGTGLFGLNFVTDKTSFTGIDTSEAMLDELKKKLTNHPSRTKTLSINLEENNLDDKFDAIVSSMAFHHLNDPLHVLRKLKDSLNQNGKIAIVDLDKEDGTFHPSNEEMGVKHNGFSKEILESWAKELNLEMDHKIINTIEKNDKRYDQFLALYSLK